jgi:Glycosyl transferase family 2
MHGCATSHRHIGPKTRVSAATDTFNHAFVIPVYGQSPHLGECIESILRQSVGAPNILLGTSTPSLYLDGVASQYGLTLHVNTRQSNIASDWNFVMQASDAQFLTVAHQDDVYDAEYLAAMVKMANNHPNFVLAFSDYREHTSAGPRNETINLKIKRLLCERAFQGSPSISSAREKRRLLSLGNPICCPSVMLNRLAAPQFVFSESLKSNLDWDAWLRLADQPGDYLYSREKLLSKRVHPQSETSATIASRVRQNEDRRMFERFWPAPVAMLLSTVYSLGYIANKAF